MAIFARDNTDTMNNIRVCLASDPELREEFLEMAGFIADLNLKLSTYDQGILMDKWMFCPDGGNREQRLDAWREKLDAADCCLVLFWKKISLAAYEDLQLAVDYLNQGKLKKLHVFFKKTDDEEPQTKELREQFAHAYGKHFNVFTSVDELKYRGVNFYLTDVDVRIDKHLLVSQFRNRMTVGGNLLADLFQVTCYGKNPVFMQLAEEVQELRRDLRLLTPESMEYAEKCDRIEMLSTRLDSLVECIWNLSLMEAKKSDEYTNKMLMKTLQLFHDGQFEQADEALDLEELERMTEEALEKPEENRKLLLDLLDAHKAKIALVTGLEKPGWREVVQELYVSMTSLAKGLHGKYSEEVADILLWRTIFLLTQMEDYDQGLQLATEMNAIRTKLFTGEHVKLAQALNLVGEALECGGDYEDAWKKYEMAYEMCSSPMVKGSPWEVDCTTAFICTNLANLASHSNQMRTYLDYEEMALEKLEASCGKFTQLVGQKYENVGLTYLNLGMIDNAYGYLWDSVRIRERLSVGMATGDLAGAYDAFAQVCSMKKEDGLALEYFHKSLNMTQQLFGEYHVNTTHCYTALGQEQLRQGLFSEAEDSFRRVIGILDMILEEKADEQILQGYGNLMKLYTKMGEAEKADEMKKKIAELRALSRGDKTE